MRVTFYIFFFLALSGNSLVAQNYYYALEEPQETVPQNATEISNVNELIAGLNSGANLYLLPGTYTLNSTINLRNIHDLTVAGANGATISGNLEILLQFLGNAKNICFRNVMFNSTSKAKTETGGGIIYFNQISAENIFFEDCSFTCPNLNANGLKFVSENNARSHNINILRCKFKDIGRMGIETQNHNTGNTVRIKNVNVLDCYFENLGMQSPFGMAISLSGTGKNAVLRNNTIIDAKNHGIEGVSWDEVLISNNVFSSKNNGYNPISLNHTTGKTNYLTGIVITGNSGTVKGEAHHLVELSAIDGLIYTKNSFYTGSLHLKDVKNSSITENFHSADGGIGLYVERFSTKNTITNNTLITTRDNANVVVFYPTATANILNENNVIKKGKGGSKYDDVDGGNYILD